MSAVNNFSKNIINLTKRTLIVLLVLYFYSCNSKTTITENYDSISQLQEKAVHCVLEEYYQNTTKKVQSSTILIVQKKSFYFKTGLGKIRDNFQAVRGVLNDTVSIKTIPKIKFVKSVKLSDFIVARNEQGLKESYWRFSPLFTTQSQGFYLILSEKSNYESREVSIHLIRRKKSGRFEYLLPVNDYIVFN